MTQEHAKYEQEVIYGTTYDTHIYIWKIYSKLVYVGLAQAGPNHLGGFMRSEFKVNERTFKFVAGKARQ